MNDTRDIVVTVPKGLWLQWLGEGDLPGDPIEEVGEWDFYLGGAVPGGLSADARCYVVAHGMLRGYAPIVRVDRADRQPGGSLVRGGGAVAVTLYPENRGTVPLVVPGFRGFRDRWWKREDEVAFPEYATAGLPAKLEAQVRQLLAIRARGPVERKKLRAWALGRDIETL